MTGDLTAVYLAMLVSAFSVGVWSVLMVRMVLTVASRREQRPFILAMPVVGLTASLGTLASAVAFWSAMEPTVDFNGEILSLVASMGRGGLLMGGVIALAYYRPKGGE